MGDVRGEKLIVAEGIPCPGRRGAHYVLKGAGVTVSRACLVHINNQYVRNGDLEPDKLFTIEDLTDTVRDMEDFVRGEIMKMREMLKGDVPSTDIGPTVPIPSNATSTGIAGGTSRKIPSSLYGTEELTSSASTGTGSCASRTCLSTFSILGRGSRPSSSLQRGSP
jgi:hypothetical protein